MSFAKKESLSTKTWSELDSTLKNRMIQWATDELWLKKFATTH